MNKILPLALVLAATFITSSAQIFYKLGTIANLNFFGILNFYIIIGFLLYALAAFLVIFAFKHGQVSMLYPLFATSYIWVSILSSYLFNENISQVKLLGIAAIIAGVSFIGFDANNFKKSGVG